MAYTTINKGSSYFNTVTYTGTGVSRNQTGVGFDPDWVWIKSRSNAYNNNVWDRVRGAGQRLITNDTGAEETQTGDMSAFVTDGITVGAGNITNANGATFVMWNWLANNTSGSSNTAGSITSTVSANTTAGFSIVSYTGTGSAATVGHGLGVAPKMIIFKNRGGAVGWACYNSNLGNTNYIALNETIASEAIGSVLFNSTSPTSSVFSIGTGDRTNSSSVNYIAYCFAEVKGYSKFGSYTGNGSSDGTFIYTGFKPAFILTKRTNGTGSWVLQDNKRPTYNQGGSYLYASASNTEANDLPIDILSNGFKQRQGIYNDTNGSGDSYIYMAFAENPFVTSGGIPVTAR